MKEEFAPRDSTRSHELHLKHHMNYTWVLYLNMVIGLWLISDPFTFNYALPITVYSTIGSGVAIILLSFLALHPYRIWAKWGIIFVGLGLYFIPMVFYSETAASFSTLYIIATLIVGLNLLVTNQPGYHLFRTPGPVTPPGWSYNPSAWEERIPVLTIAWIGFLVARYMGAYQLDYIGNITDPAFGDGTMKVLDSKVSESFPVSDATLGAVSYILDVLMGYLGSTARWRTMPWVVIIFAILIIPLGVVSITLVILQPVAVGYWCFYCLITAFISVSMMPFTFDEAAASIGFLIKARKEGHSFWKVFWKGGTLKNWPVEEYPEYKQDRLLHSTVSHLFADLKNKPWFLFICAGIGIWIMVIPGMFGFSESTLGKSNIIVGALTFTFSIATMSEVARVGRFVNILFALWLAGSVFFFIPENTEAGYKIAHWISAAALIGFSIPTGPVVDKHSMWDKYIK